MVSFFSLCMIVGCPGLPPFSAHISFLCLPGGGGGGGYSSAVNRPILETFSAAVTVIQRPTFSQIHL
jgi:hypothetical protein